MNISFSGEYLKIYFVTFSGKLIGFGVQTYFYNAFMGKLWVLVFKLTFKMHL